MNTYKRDIEKFWGNQWMERVDPIDFTNRAALHKFNIFIKPVLDDLPLGAKICELGVGLGSWLYLAKSYRPDLELYGADLSEFAVSKCNASGIKCQVADIRTLPYSDNEFDAVFSWGVIEHMLDSELAVTEQFRVAKHYAVLDVPYGPSLAHISTKRAAKRRGLTEYEFMIEFGRFFNQRSFKTLIHGALGDDIRVKFINNYLVLPGRLSKFDDFVPDFVRSLIGHNIGCVITKI